VRLVSSVFVGTVWGILLVRDIASGGVQSPTFMGGCLMAIVAAGLIQGGPASGVLTGLSLLAGGAMLWAERQGLILPPASDPAVSMNLWIASIFLFPLVALFQQLAVSTLNQALKRARASEAKFRTVFETAPYSITLTDLDGHYLEMSRAVDLRQPAPIRHQYQVAGEPLDEASQPHPPRPG
jgi:PAS domain-containing protein